MSVAATQPIESEPTRKVCNGSEPRTLRILAKSTYKELKDGGLSPQELVSFTTELLELVTEDFSQNGN